MTLSWGTGGGVVEHIGFTDVPTPSVEIVITGVTVTLIIDVCGLSDIYRISRIL